MLRIVEENICETHESTTSSETLTSADIFTRYADLFDGSLGCMEGEVHLAVPPPHCDAGSFEDAFLPVHVLLSSVLVLPHD